MVVPIEQLMKSIDWQEEPPPETPPIDGEVYATHSGAFGVGGYRFRCYRLSTGEAVIDSDDVARFFEGN